jgi:hypothetical protein
MSDKGTQGSDRKKDAGWNAAKLKTRFVWSSDETPPCEVRSVSFRWYDLMSQSASRIAPSAGKIQSG